MGAVFLSKSVSASYSIYWHVNKKQTSIEYYLPNREKCSSKLGKSSQRNINADTNGLQGINLGHSGTTGVLPGNGRVNAVSVNPKTVVTSPMIDHK